MTRQILLSVHASATSRVETILRFSTLRNVEWREFTSL